MTKAQVQDFCKRQGWSYSYSGKPKKAGGGLYVNPHDEAVSLDDIEIAVTQEFAVLPDFKLFKA